MKHEPLFNIDFEQWSLPVNHETGLPKEPVESEDFDGYAYWNVHYKGPIRQILSKSGNDFYGDYLVAASGTLRRGVIGLVDSSPYDTEYTKEQWERLCQTTVMRYQYNKLINTDAVVPLLSRALSEAYFSLGEEPYFKRGDRVFRLNGANRALEPTTIDPQVATEIQEEEYYYLSLSALIKVFGKEEILSLEPFNRRRVPFTIESVSYVPCENCEAHAITATQNTRYTCQNCGHVGEVPTDSLNT